MPRCRWRGPTPNPFAVHPAVPAQGQRGRELPGLTVDPLPVRHAAGSVPAREDGATVPKDKSFKRRVRSRMTRTGERYTAARAVMAPPADGGQPVGPVFISRPGLVTDYRPADWVWETLEKHGIPFVYGLPVRAGGNGRPDPERRQSSERIVSRVVEEKATALLILLAPGAASFVPAVLEGLSSAGLAELPVAGARPAPSPEFTDYLEQRDPRHKRFYDESRAAAEAQLHALVAIGVPIFTDDQADDLVAWLRERRR